MKKNLLEIKSMKRATELKEMPDGEFFQMPEFEEYLNDTLNAVCSRSRHIRLKLFHSPGGEAAMTDGSTVFGNTACRFVDAVPDRNGKIYVLVGMIVHECAHVLFTDFRGAVTRMNGFMDGRISADGKTAERFSRSGKGFRAYAFRYYKYLDNLVDDKYIESRIPLKFAGMPAFCLKKARKASYGKLPPLGTEELLRGGTAAAVLNAMLMQIGGKVKWKDEQETRNLCPAEYAEYASLLKKCSALADTVTKKDADTSTVEKAVDKIFALLLPVIEREYGEKKRAAEQQKQAEKRKTEEKAEKGQTGKQQDGDGAPEGMPGREKPEGEKPETEDCSNGGPDSSEPDDAEPEETEPEESDEEPETEGSETGEPEEEPSGDENGTETEDPGPQLTGEELEEIESALTEEAERLMQQMEESAGMPERPDLDLSPAHVPKAEEQETTEPCLEMAKKELTRDSRSREIRELVEMMSELEHVRLDIDISYPSADRKAYEEAYAKVSALVDRTVRMLENILKERQREGKITGLPVGRKIDCRRAYRDENRIFTKRLVPDGDPEIAFGIVVDESGSMRTGSKYLSARQAAVALDAVLVKMGIPHEITGHTAPDNWPSAQIMKYVGFDSFGPKGPCYSLGRITHMNCNHDLCALVHMSQELMRRPERRKVLMIISDGQPNGYLFSGSAACDAMGRFVEDLDRKGIPVVAAAIAGSDNGKLKGIYGERRTLDISDPSQLPQALVKVMKKYVLARGT